MEDGVLLLLVRFFSYEVDEINRLCNENIKFICNHPDCGGDTAIEWIEGELAIRELRESLPRIVIDAAEGVDDDLDDVDHLAEVFDEFLEELPF